MRAEGAGLVVDEHCAGSGRDECDTGHTCGCGLGLVL